jgi:hypothetical protein
MNDVIMLDTFILVYIPFVMILIEIKKVLSQELKCFYIQQEYHSPIRMNKTQNYKCESLTFLMH